MSKEEIINLLKEKLMPVSILCLSLSIIISAVIISRSIKNTGEYVGGNLTGISQGLFNIGGSAASLNTTNDIYDLNLAASYLRIPEDQFKLLVDSGSDIPHIKIGSQYIFSRSALDKWLENTKLEIK